MWSRIALPPLLVPTDNEASGTVTHPRVMGPLRTLPGATTLKIVWPSLISFEARFPVKRDGLTFRKETRVRPDGLLCLLRHRPDHPSRELRYYIEVDRSTESLSTLQAKALAYQHHYVEDHQFRVVFVFQTVQRLHNARKALSELPGPRPFLYSHSPEKQILGRL